jgi:TonB family protein
MLRGEIEITNMTKTTLIILGLFLFSLTLKSQEKIQLYYNWDWEITEKSKTAYVREAEYDLNSMKLEGKVIDYNRLGAKIMEGNYSNGEKNGEFIFFYNNGVIESKGEYSYNKRIGNWEYYYSNGKLKQIIYFSNGRVNMDFAVIEYYDREGNQLVKNGTGKWVNDSVRTGLFDGSSLKRLTGQFKDSLKEGEWKLIRLSDNKFMHSEKFKKGRFIDASVYVIHSKQIKSQTINMSISMDNSAPSEVVKNKNVIETRFYAPSSSDYIGSMNSEMLNKIPDPKLNRLNTMEKFKLDTAVFPASLVNADVETIFRTVTGKEVKITNRKVMYPDGDYGLLAFIGARLRYPLTAQVEGVKGRVFVSASVDSLGNTKEVKILKGIREDLDNEALRVVKLIPKWLPEIRDGEAVESAITIPVKFDLKN